MFSSGALLFLYSCATLRGGVPITWIALARECQRFQFKQNNTGMKERWHRRVSCCVAVLTRGAEESSVRCYIDSPAGKREVCIPLISLCNMGPICCAIMDIRG